MYTIAWGCRQEKSHFHILCRTEKNCYHLIQITREQLGFMRQVFTPKKAFMFLPLLAPLWLCVSMLFLKPFRRFLQTLLHGVRRFPPKFSLYLWTVDCQWTDKPRGSLHEEPAKIPHYVYGFNCRRNSQNALGVIILTCSWFIKTSKSSSPVIMKFAFPLTAVPIILTSSLSRQMDSAIRTGTTISELSCR